jgi:hypothetical protein
MKNRDSNILGFWSKNAPFEFSNTVSLKSSDIVLLYVKMLIRRVRKNLHAKIICEKYLLFSRRRRIREKYLCVSGEHGEIGLLFHANYITKCNRRERIHLKKANILRK